MMRLSLGGRIWFPEVAGWPFRHSLKRGWPNKRSLRARTCDVAIWAAHRFGHSNFSTVVNPRKVAVSGERAGRE